MDTRSVAAASVLTKLFFVSAAVALFALASTFVVAPLASEDANHPGKELTGSQQGLRALSGSQVRVYDAQLTDAFVAGGEVEFEQVSADDLFVAGGSVRIRGVTVEDVVIAGGEIELQAEIDDDLLAAGGRVRLDPKTIISGDAVIAGGDVEVDGRIDGNVTLVAGRVMLAGVIGGDVHVSAGQIVVGPRAQISGKFVYRSEDGAQISSQAVITGGVEHQVADLPQLSKWAVAGIGVSVLLIALVSMALMAAVLQAVVARPISAAVARFHAAPWTTWMIGFALLVSVPVAANVLLVLVIGIPLGVLLFALYTVALALGIVTTAHELGRLVSRGARATPATPVGASLLARTAFGMLLLALLALIPLIGWLALLAAIPAGVGAFAIECWGHVFSSMPSHDDGSTAERTILNETPD